LQKNRYVIAVGANLGDRYSNLKQAAYTLVTSSCAIIAEAPIYITEPVGGVADLPFLNTAWLVQTELGPRNVLRVLQSIEQQLGRVRQEQWGNRTIDLDILLWQSARKKTTDKWLSDELSIPHPRLLQRDFMLQPAALVAGDWMHPDTGLTLLEECLGRGYLLAPAEEYGPVLAGSIKIPGDRFFSAEL
jgi:2-amino-4-hydroxy-6-hydroxymethyldihydropteridine diphosphokinase